MNRKLKNEELERLSITEFKEADKMPVVVVLDNVRSLHNVGSVFRSCDAFRAGRIIVCGITAQPPHREIEKTALGATETVDWNYEAHTATALAHLKTEGYHIAIVEQVTGSTSLADFVPPAGKPLALVFGHEVNGVSEECLPLADSFLEIAQQGTKHSLNIAVSAGIVLWHCATQIKKRAHQ